MVKDTLEEHDHSHGDHDDDHGEDHDHAHADGVWGWITRWNRPRTARRGHNGAPLSLAAHHDQPA